MTIHRSYVLALLLVAVTIRLFLFLTQVPVLWPDSMAYFRLATEIANRGEFAAHPLYRTPLYSSLLAFILKLSGGAHLDRSILAIQLGLGVVSTLLLYFIAACVFSRNIAFGTAFLFSILPLELFYECVIQPEVLFVALFFAFVLALCSSVGRPTAPRMLMCGLLFGLLLLTRPIAQVLVPVIFVALFMSGINRIEAAKKGVILATAAFFVIAPWLLVNHQTFGVFSLSRETGLNMFHRVFDTDHYAVVKSPRFSEAEMHFVYKAEALAAKANRRDQPSYFYVYRGLHRSGLGWVETDQLMAKMAREALRENPLPYLLSSVKQLGNFFSRTNNSLSFCDSPNGKFFCASSGRGLSIPEMRRQPLADYFYLRQLVFQLLSLLSFPAWLFGLFGLGGMIASLGPRSSGSKIQSCKLLLLILLPLAFAVPVAMLNSAEDRFRLPVEGLLIAFSLYLASALIQATRSLRSHKMPVGTLGSI